MQVPEKLSLIGGSILLASTLVFTLKSQASNILPEVNNGVSSLMKTDQERQQDQQKQQEQAFNNNFQQAQQNHWQTGTWGTAKFYVDDQGNMHVGSGELDSSYMNVVDINKIHTINLDGATQAPQDSSHLFSYSSYGNDNETLSQINNLSNLDTSNVTNMEAMFNHDSSLDNLDLSHFDTSKVTTMNSMFNYNHSLSNLNVSHFDTSKVTDMSDMFYDDSSLNGLDLSHFNTSHIIDMENMLNDVNVHQLGLGPDTKIQNNSNSVHYDTYLSGTYQNNGQTLNLDGNAHPGTWIRQ